METESRLAVLPFHILAEGEDDVTITRGTVQVKLESENILATLRSVCERLAVGPQTRSQLIEQLPPGMKQSADALIQILLDRRILVEDDGRAPFLPDMESPLDIFNWHFQLPASMSGRAFEHKPVTVVGLNYISKTLVPALKDAGFTGVTVVDDVFLRRDAVAESDVFGVPLSPGQWLDDFASAKPTVIVCSDTGSETIVREWNRLCVRNNLRVVPVLLRGVIGFVGPIVLPGDTACFECNVRREQLSRMFDVDSREALALEKERGAVAGFHPSMAGVLAHFAAMEVFKFLGQIPAYTAGVVFDINLMRPDLVPRRVLKVPGCPVCSDINTVPVHSLVDVEKVL